MTMRCNTLIISSTVRHRRQLRQGPNDEEGNCDGEESCDGEKSCDDGRCGGGETVSLTLAGSRQQSSGSLDAKKIETIS
jgi:hypothetical protein